MTMLLPLSVLGIAIGLSLWLRVRHYRGTLDGVQTKQSPFSVAVQDLVGTRHLDLVLAAGYAGEGHFIPGGRRPGSPGLDRYGCRSAVTADSAQY
jgi:hypothetical protein